MLINSRVFPDIAERRRTWFYMQIVPQVVCRRSAKSFPASSLWVRLSLDCQALLHGYQNLSRIGLDWPQMGQIWDFLSQNVLKLILKSPRYVPFRAIRTQLCTSPEILNQNVLKLMLNFNSPRFVPFGASLDTSGSLSQS